MTKPVVISSLSRSARNWPDIFGCESDKQLDGFTMVSAIFDLRLNVDFLRITGWKVTRIGNRDSIRFSTLEPTLGTMNINFPILLLAALAPMIIGFLWYGPLFGKAWMAESDMTMEKARAANMVKTFGLSYLFCVMVAFTLQFMVIHQYSLFSMVQNDARPEVAEWLRQSTALFEGSFRTFKHGMLHGFMAGVTFALPLIGLHALYEQRSAKYIFIHAGYWIISMMLMGGVICQWA